jgi:choline dehydrogenase/5-(hydroxymethyl)furfural/furfural oxidase
VLAARLSEAPHRSVVLVEAGPDLRGGSMPDAIRGPSFHRARAIPERSWADLMAVRAAGQTPRPYIRGRGVGGSSAINAMVALPGLPEDYDEWERRWGCRNWGWQSVSPWFDRVAVSARTDAVGAIGAATLASCSAARRAPLTIDADGLRISVVDAYLEPARHRTNLTVIADAPVHRVLIERGRAVGVELGNGTVLEGERVVISAGAIHSPVVLARSGIDRPGVGTNLHDHPSVVIPLLRRNLGDPDERPIAVIAPLSIVDREDAQLLPMETVDTATPELGAMLVAAMQVRSRGLVALGTDGTVSIEFDMLSDERDATVLRNALRHAEAMFADACWADVVVDPPAALGDDLRGTLGDYVHAVGTCRMGADDDDGAVVDARCNVIGVRNLTVCDASVIPAIPRANTHLPVLMIAERISSYLAAF